MEIKTRESFETAKELACSLLVGASFSGFQFTTSFSLEFIREGIGKFKDFELPSRIEIQIFDEWWFGTKEEWQLLINEFSSARDHIEPNEPVKAYELTRLRWKDGATIESIVFEKDKFIISFQSGISISISSISTVDYSWQIKEYGVHETDSTWLITCENNKFYVRCPVHQ